MMNLLLKGVNAFINIRTSCKFIMPRRGMKKKLQMEIHPVCKKKKKVKINFSDTKILQAEDDISIIQLDDGQYSHKIDISKVLKYFLNDKGEAQKKRIESETNTTIYIPKKEEGKEMCITGNDRDNVISAKNHINQIIKSTLKKIALTHFLSVPMNTDSIKAKFEEFKCNVLKNAEEDSQNIPEKLFQKPEKLHLTIAIMTLLTDEEKDCARDVLLKCKEHVIDPIINESGEIKMKLEGVQIMNNNPEKANVLFASINDSSGNCQKLFDEIYQYFVKSGIVELKEDQVKMHVTFMNTKFLRKKRKKFDATKILKEHEKTCFGEITISSVHLSQCNASGEDGYYKPTEIINFLATEKQDCGATEDSQSDA